MQPKEMVAFDPDGPKVRAIPAIEARTRRLGRSIPQVVEIVENTQFLQQLQIFLLKCLRSLMLFLAVDL